LVDELRGVACERDQPAQLRGVGDRNGDHRRGHRDLDSGGGVGGDRHYIATTSAVRRQPTPLAHTVGPDAIPHGEWGFASSVLGRRQEKRPRTASWRTWLI
jgi:hypothetical protein